MVFRRYLALGATLSMCVSAFPVAALTAEVDTSASSESSASSSSSSSDEIDARTAVRIERCRRFAKGDDYNRCVRLIRRLPSRSTIDTPLPGSAEDNAGTDENGDEWKWTNILNRMEAKIKTMVKFVNVMGRNFCRDRTIDNSTTSQECMSRLREELKVRIDRMFDEIFRAQLPSAR